MKTIEKTEKNVSRIAIGGRGARSVIVLLGMVLFVCGFLLILMSLSETDDAASQRTLDEGGTALSEASPSEYIAIVGLAMSAGGVLLATLGPALAFVSWSKSIR